MNMKNDSDWIFCGGIFSFVMGGSCSMYGGGKRCVRGFGGESLRERDHWGDPSINGKIILRQNFRQLDVGVWTGLG
jgi:hypothetical protein